MDDKEYDIVEIREKVEELDKSVNQLQCDLEKYYRELDLALAFVSEGFKKKEKETERASLLYLLLAFFIFLSIIGFYK